MVTRFLKNFLLTIVVLVLIGLSLLAFAQTASQLEEECGTREECEALLKKYEEEIAKYENDITKTQAEKDTLANKITILKNQIKKLEIQISQSTLMVKDLSLQIEDTKDSIDKTSLKIEESKEKISSILRTIYEEDQKSLVEILISDLNISNFFDDLMALEVLNSKNRDLLNEVKNLKSYLENQKESIDQEKGELEEILKIQQLQKQESEYTKKQQESILEKTKGKESEYQKLLKATKERAAEIRARIFELIGVPEAPTFGEAYEIAKYVEGITGVRPALLLAVLTQESNIGKNVGQCYLRDATTGSGVTAKGKAISNVMKPSRDIKSFLTITQELGRDPFNTPVSCPMSYGYGGAMGPAQFIPSTWSRYKERVKAITGNADPWNIRDAFVAAALYLKDYGAASQNSNNEWKAAMIYFSGSTNSKYKFYGDSVLAIASQYEKDIQELERLAKTNEPLSLFDIFLKILYHRA
jgi:membrane-bound lytic murein transglycosylase B